MGFLSVFFEIYKSKGLEMVLNFMSFWGKEF